MTFAQAGHELGVHKSTIRDGCLRSQDGCPPGSTRGVSGESVEDEIVRVERQLAHPRALLEHVVDEEDHGRAGVGALAGEDVAELPEAAATVDEMGNDAKVLEHAISTTPTGSAP